MNCIVWNARGLGNSRAFHELRRLIFGFSPQLLFISETKIKAGRCRNWRAIFGFDGQFVVDSKGASGGLILFWKNPLDVDVLNFSVGHVDCMVTMDDKKWRFTGFYGNPDHSKRVHSWELMRRLSSCYSDEVPWVLGGDFNEILRQHEKRGGPRRSWAQIAGFRSALNSCGLKDVKNDADFTWYNQRQGDDAVFLLLDRFLINRQGVLAFGDKGARVLDDYGSDHRPVSFRYKRRKSVFRRFKEVPF